MEFLKKITIELKFFTFLKFKDDISEFLLIGQDEAATYGLEIEKDKNNPLNPKTSHYRITPR